MNLRARAISALLIIAFLTVPSLVVSQRLAVPLERGILPGVTTVFYADHTLVFTTAVPLKIKLQVVPAGHVVLSFKKTTLPGYGQGMGSATGGHTVVFWEQANDDVYSGTAPDDWTDVPLGEGGWTEK
jgi:hypothetical protein